MGTQMGEGTHKLEIPLHIHNGYETEWLLSIGTNKTYM